MNASKLSPDDPRLTAYALGELSRDESAAVEAAMADDPLARAYVEETRRFAAHLQGALVDEPLPKSDETNPPASQLHLLPPYELKTSKLLQFPQLYFVVGGLAAACFAVMIALRQHSAPAEVAKQYVAIELGNSRVAASPADAADAVTDVEESAESSGSEKAMGVVPPAPVMPFDSRRESGVAVPPGNAAGLIADATKQQAVESANAAAEPNATATPGSRAGDNVVASADRSTAKAAGAASSAEPLKRIVPFVAKRKRPARPAQTNGAIAPELADGTIRPTVEHPDFAAIAPLPPVAPPKDEPPGGEFVAATANPVAKIVAPVDTGSFAAITKAVSSDSLPDPRVVAIEELLNRGVGAPSGSRPPISPGAVDASGEIGPAPWSPTHRLVRVTIFAGGAPAGAPATLAAKDVSMEVEFNPRRVRAYRMIGYERKETADRPYATALTATDFRAHRTVVALFEIIPAAILTPADPEDPTYSARHLVSEEAPRIRPEMLTLHVRYRHAVTGMREKVETAIEDDGATFLATTGDFKYFAGVAAYGMILRHSSYRGRATLSDAIAWAEAGVGTGPAAHEREEMLDLMRRTRAVALARHG